jgi:Flp pilus assembly protein TadG
MRRDHCRITAMPAFRIVTRLTALISRFRHGRDANIAVIFALAMVPCIYLLGMTLDYTQAVRKRSQLNAAADAAAIAAVTPAMMSQSNSAAQAAALKVFNATASNLPGLSSAVTPTVTVSNVGLVRNVVVSYSAGSTNNFPSLLGPTAWPIGGSSSASASGAPNINFYLLLDDSPSMAIAANQNDINTLIANTPNQVDSGTNAKGCGFACHESHPSSDNLGNPYGEDNYALARSLKLTLRIDLVAQAVASLMTTAQAKEKQNNNTYAAAIYTFDNQVNTIYAPSGLPTTDLSTAATQTANNIQVLEVYDNNCLTKSNCNSDTDTNLEGALQSINNTMPTPGTGTTQTGDTPQEVVFLVTDGVDDEIVTSASACSQTALSLGSGNYRCQQPIDTAMCTTIKNRGIRIAVLYTEYLQLTSNSWYNDHIAQIDNPSPDKGTIAQNLQSCASPNLFYDVQSGGDITAALTNLFLLVVNTAAHLTN